MGLTTVQSGVACWVRIQRVFCLVDVSHHDPVPDTAVLEDAMFDLDSQWLVFETVTKIQFPRPISGRFLLAFLGADLLCCSHKCATCAHRQRCFSPPTALAEMYIKLKKDLNRIHR